MVRNNLGRSIARTDQVLPNLEVPYLFRFQAEFLTPKNAVLIPSIF